MNSARMTLEEAVELGNKLLLLRTITHTTAQTFPDSRFADLMALLDYVIDTPLGEINAVKWAILVSNVSMGNPQDIIDFANRSLNSS